MDRRTVSAIILCLGIWMAWQKFYLEPRTLTPPASQPASTLSAQGTGTGPGATLGQGTQAPVPAQLTLKHPSEVKELTLKTGTARISDQGKFFQDWTNNSYHLGIAPQAAAVDLRSVTNLDGAGELAFDLPEYSYLSSVQGNLIKTPQGLLWGYEDSNVKLTREYQANESQSYVDLKLGAEFKNKKPGYAFVSIVSQSPANDAEAQDRNLVYWTDKSIEKVNLGKSVELKQVATPVKWIGSTNRYFLMTLISQGSEPQALIQPGADARAGRINLVYPMTASSISLPVRAFFGPKELDVLRSVEPTLDHTVDFGMFTIIAYPLLKLMKTLYGLIKNYGVAIILLTILVKILTYPLTYKSMKSMKEMAKLQPQLQKLREKYKDDKESLNREMIGLMKGHGYNPAAGCFPILIQMPVFFALYRVLYSSIELYHAPFYFWIQDLSAKDPFYVTPVLMTITMYIQQKLTPNTATDPAQQKMMQFMPVIFGVFMLQLPAGLTIYMLVNALSSIVQQLLLNKKLGGGPGSGAVVAARA